MPLGDAGGDGVEIAGVGEARVEKYGDAFLRLLREAFAATGATPPEPAGAA